MSAVDETVYAGRDNTFSLQLIRGGEALPLLAVTGFNLYLGDERVINDQSCFTPKANGVVEISVGRLLSEDDVGTHQAWLITFDPVNTNGVRWPAFKLRVKP